jgi:chemotaxis protein methyltransferase CheR
MFQGLSPKDIQRLALIVQEETGNQVQDKNHSMLESRLRSHMLKIGISNTDTYWKHFELHEEEERQALKSLMTTHYTFFFREYSHFEALEAWIQSNLVFLKERFEKNKTPLRIWSAACSKGQEVYSLAMFLNMVLTGKHGIDFEVYGTDIDKESVAIGKNGVYPISEVNTIPQHFLQGNWKRGTGSIKDFAAIHPKLKTKTQFEVLNLFELKKWRPELKFDVIFCRNVFIYFSEENVKKTALDLASRLIDGGLFVSGVSEPLRFKEWQMNSPSPSCYIKAPKGETKPQEQKPSPALVQSSFEMQAKKYSVLCVDDSMTIQALMKKIFASDPQCENIEVAFHGQDAREKLDKKHFDLITLDIHMPQVNGIEFLQKLYKPNQDPPVMMVSSVNRTDEDLAIKALSLGASDYVEKPAMNNLAKSTEEILTKAKMLLRSNSNAKSVTSLEYSTSIGQKIVVPDASQCLRIVVANDQCLSSLEQILKFQESELRSPAMLVFYNAETSAQSIEASLLQWTDRSIQRLRSGQSHYKPNTIWIAEYAQAEEVFKKLLAPRISLQILCQDSVPAHFIQNTESLQILLDERISSFQTRFEDKEKLLVSDITPSTSFPSLSVEFFANVRKLAA